MKKDVFPSCHERGTKKKFWVPMRNRTSDLRIPHSDALPLSHRDSTVSEVYYEVHMTRVLHTARISNIDSVMFVVEIREIQQLYSTGRTEHFRFKFLISSQARFKLSSLGCPWVREGRGGGRMFWYYRRLTDKKRNGWTGVITSEVDFVCVLFSSNGILE